ncbi:MAG: AIR synthase-related protein, partial [Coriobacteriia bacterium]|nr:AIR synthase-related protein [Coriobacteriia bacterium]
NTTLKRGLETEDSIRDVIEAMARLNKAASEAMVQVGVNAGTDVTGFGLVGHLREMVLGSDCAAELDLASVPIWPQALEYSRVGVRPGRTEDVIADLDPVVDWGPADDAWRGVLADPQTSGGLLMAVDPARCDELLEALDRRGESGSVIGRCVEGIAGQVRILA